MASCIPWRAIWYDMRGFMASVYMSGEQ